MLVLSGTAWFVGHVLDQWPIDEALGNQTQDFGLSHSFLPESWDSSTWTLGIKCKWKNLLPGWNFLHLEFSELWQFTCMCGANVLFYMEDRCIIASYGYLWKANIIASCVTWGERWSSRDQVSHLSSPDRASDGMGWCYQFPIFPSSLTETLRRQGCEAQTSCWRRLRNKSP